MVQAINCRAVAVVQYEAGIVEWTKEDPYRLMTQINERSIVLAGMLRVLMALCLRQCTRRGSEMLR